jgi:hypothetical protein
MRRSEPHHRPRLEPPGIFWHLYRIATARILTGHNRLFLNVFPPYPEIIEQSSRLIGGLVNDEWEATGTTALLAGVRARGFSADGQLLFPQICREPDSTPLRRERIH